MGGKDLESTEVFLRRPQSYFFGIIKNSLAESLDTSLTTDLIRCKSSSEVHLIQDIQG